MAKAAFALEQWEKCEEYLKVVRDSGIQDQEVEYYSHAVQFYKEAWAKEQELRKAEAEADDLPRVLLKTTKGDIVVELFEDQAPNTVANFISLVEKGFYDGIAFHRVIPGFMAQGGDPRGDGTGGPGYRIRDEYDLPGARLHFRGSLSMANTGQPDTNGSQFFITYMPTGHLNHKHTVFGRVIKGMDVVDKLQPRDPQRDTDVEPDKILEAKVLRKRDHEYKPETLPE
ncbi:MAG: peptidylprolyl isomerase [Planctomycetota bacterium]|nr:MAG: peptidylprolyl isomerase [Planctomycetota bacterium]